MIMKSNFKCAALGVLATGLMSSATLADQQFLDDVIVVGSLCAGQDCNNGESFGFDTIRMKENNLRLHFDDTSNSASFPQNDWRLVANDSGNGGSNYLAIEDATAGRIPFRVESGARANSLVVESDGDVGFGTLNPVVTMHAVEGNTPTLRLEQDGSSGFTPQTFDIAANEANFFIRDATNGSQLPFRIAPGADTNSISISNTNNVGMGIQTAAASLHVRRTDGTAKLFVEEASNTTAARTMAQFKNKGITQIALTNTDGVEHTWNIQNRGAPDNNDFRITNGAATGAAGAELVLSQTGDLIIKGSITTGGGTCGGGCDLVFEADYDLPSIADHNQEMWANKYLPNVGPTKENAPINVSDKLGRMLNELEHAHIYIGQLHARLEALEAKAAVAE